MAQKAGISPLVLNRSQRAFSAHGIELIFQRSRDSNGVIEHHVLHRHSALCGFLFHYGLMMWRQSPVRS